MKTASLPITTPCSLAPISAPHIQNGRLSSTAWVRPAWAISIQVQRSFSPGRCSRRGRQSNLWPSLGSRSEFLAKSTRSGRTMTMVSHISAIIPRPRPRRGRGRIENQKSKIENPQTVVHHGSGFAPSTPSTSTRRPGRGAERQRGKGAWGKKRLLRSANAMRVPLCSSAPPPLCLSHQRPRTPTIRNPHFAFRIRVQRSILPGRRNG